jgi:ribosomal protein S18 acetylase RimI-like enzyme
MLKPHDFPFTQARAVEARAFGPDLALLDGSAPGAADIRRAHAITGKKGRNLCLFEPGLGMVVVSVQARAELAAVTRGLASLIAPVRVLLCPEESAPRVIRSLEAAQGRRFTFQRRQKLLFLETPAPAAASAPGRMRRATPADADAISCMITRQEGELLDPKTLAQGLAGSGRAYLWECEGPVASPVASPVAVAALGCEDDASVDINTVNTKPGARGKGFAFALLQRLIAEGITPKAACVLVDENNAPAQALYKKLGFKFACAWRYAEVAGSASP